MATINESVPVSINARPTWRGASITTQVKAKLTGEKAANLTRVSVKTVNGTVSLTGNVPTAADRTRAEEIARGVSGVQQVTNNLQTDKP
jgi:hyperosmotically inducible periplasmic protein